MKFRYTHTLRGLLPLILTLALALVAVGSRAAEPETAPVQPPPLSTNVEEVVRLAQAGIHETVLIAFVESARQTFDLSPDQIVYVKDLGIPDTVIAAMLRQDKLVREKQAPLTNPPVITNAPPADGITNAAAPVYVTNAPPKVTYFYDSLSPYGTWVDLEGVGWCWQPSAVVVNTSWQPYWHGGNWIYSDHGWYWRSDYSWGWAPFHYGRWHPHHRFHWVWVPDTVWAPAWVTWRYSDFHCGWAPLPLGAHFVFGQGWFFNGVSVGLHFDFGLPFHHFRYVESRHLRERHLDRHGLAVPRAREIHGSTTVNNNQFRERDNRIVNPGIPADRIARITGRPVQQARIEVEQPAPARDRSVRRPERVEQVGQSLVIRRPELRAPVRAEASSVAAQKIDDRTPVIRPMPRQVQPRGLPTRRPTQAPAPGPSPGVPVPSIGAQPVRPSTPTPGAPPADSRSVPSRPSTRGVPAPAQPTPVQPPPSTPAPAPAPGSRTVPSRVFPPQASPSAPMRVPPRAPQAESPRGHQQNPAYTRPAVPPSQPAIRRTPSPSARPSAPQPQRVRPSR